MIVLEHHRRCKLELGFDADVVPDQQPFVAYLLHARDADIPKGDVEGTGSVGLHQPLQHLLA